MENFFIDPEAKTKVELTKISRDANGQPYYIGKLQFPGTLEFEAGASFFVFVSESGVEELQIAPLDPRRSVSEDGISMNAGRFTICLHPMVDQNGKTYYVGEAKGLSNIDLKRGVFFTIFTSKPGYEEIQITRLNPRKRKEERTRDVPVVSYRRQWSPRLGDSIAP